MGRILLVLVWSSFIYALFICYSCAKADDWSAFLSLCSCKGILLWNVNPFQFHLWYLQAYLYVLILVYVCFRVHAESFLKITLLLLLGANICLGNYSCILFDKSFGWEITQNFLFMGLPFFMGGYLLKEYESCFERIRQYAPMIALVLAVCSLLEYQLLVRMGEKGGGSLYILSILLSVALFLSFSRVGVGVRQRVLAKIGKQDSLYIYIFHPLIGYTLNGKVTGFLNTLDAAGELSSWYHYLNGFFVFIFTILIIEMCRRGWYRTHKLCGIISKK